MATKKVIYFTLGPVPTANELADIAKLNAFTEQPYEVHVYQAGVPQSTPVRAADYVGSDTASIPAAYSAVTVIDPDNIPTLPLPATQAAVVNGGTVNVENSAGNLDSPATASVSANTLNNVRLAATKTIVTSGQALTGVTPSGTYTNTVTFTVTDGLITAIVLS